MVLTATVARRYYLDGASKSEIAAELGLSRFKVARMLDRARTSGLVRIELHYEGEIDLDLSVRLGTQYGLRRCLVIDSPEDDEALLRANVGRVAAGLLAEIIDKDDVLGLGLVADADGDALGPDNARSVRRGATHRRALAPRCRRGLD